MSNARPSNLPTRPQTAKIKRDRAMQDKKRNAKTTRRKGEKPRQERQERIV